MRCVSCDGEFRPRDNEGVLLCGPSGEGRYRGRPRRGPSSTPAGRDGMDPIARDDHRNAGGRAAEFPLN